MNELTQKEFEQVLLSLLSEDVELKDYSFTEMSGQAFGNVVRVTNKEGAHSDLVLGSLYSGYKNGKGVNEVEEIAKTMVIGSLKDKKPEKIQQKEAEKKDAEEEKLNLQVKDFIEQVLGLCSDDLNLFDKKGYFNPSSMLNPEADDCSEAEKNIFDMIDEIEGVFKNHEEERIELLKNVHVFFAKKEHESVYKNYAYSDTLGMLAVYYEGKFNADEPFINGCITKNYIDEIGVDMMELHMTALENTEMDYPAVEHEVSGGILLTNSKCRFGATAVLYSGKLKEIAERYGCDKLIIIPLSVDAFFIVPDNGADSLRLLKKADELMKKRYADVMTNQVLQYSLKDDILF